MKNDKKLSIFDKKFEKWNGLKSKKGDYLKEHKEESYSEGSIPPSIKSILVTEYLNVLKKENNKQKNNKGN